MRRFLIILPSLVLAACGTAGQTDIAPPDAKALIIANKGRLWKDPDSIKNASIAAPTRHMGFMWHVCVRLNAKNAFGGYAGEKDTLIGIYDNGPAPHIIVDDATPVCEKQRHEAFPELNGDFVPPKAVKRS